MDPFKLTAYNLTVSKMNQEFEQTPANSQDKNWVKNKLSYMVKIDQYMRAQINLPFEHQYNTEEQEYFWLRFGSRFGQMDSKNTADLKELLKIYSWFKISEFGVQADRDAWLLVQHADLDLTFQKQVLDILTNLYPIGETSKMNYAYLWDRVSTAEQHPQRYGTQGKCVGPAQWEPFEIEDLEQVDQRRADMGLQPMAEYMKQFVNICH